ncbi:MAG TPA: hypothetical protein VNF91_07720 [Candidatus Acidoferrum sp.]|nr:hypothetical protein [Candidatus Acidoferrum sp.]
MAGYGLTYLSGIGLLLEERVAFGAVLGAMAVAALSFLFSLGVRDVTLLTVVAAVVLALLAGAASTAWNMKGVQADLADARARWSASPRSPGHPWPLAAVVLVCGAWTVHFLHQAYVYTPSGLYAGYVNIWGDWAAHLSFAGSFAYGHNFPPEYPIDPGHHLGYPFMIDFLAANLVPLGSRLTSSLVLTSGLLGLAFPAVLYLAAQRFIGGRAAPALAVGVFLLSGGLGFVYLLGDLQHFGPAALVHLPREYTLNRDLNFQWLNPVLAYLVPQRSVLFGFSLALIALAIMWVAVHNLPARRGGRGVAAGRGMELLSMQPFLFAGIVTGLMPIFHVHAYGTVVALSLFWAVFSRRVQWLGFFVPALVIGLPILAWMWPPANTSVCGNNPTLHGYCFELGWLSYLDWQHDAAIWFGRDWIWFWIKNTSVFIPVLVAAHVVRNWIPTAFPNWFAPMWLWFLVPNVIVLQPWDWDNTKFFVFWALLGSILVAGVLAHLFKRGPGSALAASALLVLLGLSGALDLTRASDYSVSAVQFTDTGGLQVADWVRTHTSPTALFVVADEHNSPIPTLAGRRVLIGYPGWLWTYGMPDFTQKGDDETRILKGDPAALELVGRYGVDYVMIGPQEIPRGASRAYWDQHGVLVYDSGEYAVYKVVR